MGLLSQVKDKIAQYLDVYIKLFKINFIGRTSNLMSYFMFALIGLFIAFCIVLFTGFGLVELFVALDLPKLASFFIVVGIYLLLLVLVIACRKQIIRFFASGFIRVLTEGDEIDKEGEEE